jgi:DNA-binding transcriptional LysR family regulator
MRSHLPDLELFAAVARHGSFTRAAKERKVSTSLVSQSIRKLEERLGVVLLRRTTRSVAPTAAGAELLAGLDPGLVLIQDAVERINAHRGSPIGTIRINAPAPIAQFRLAALAARFTHRHPDVTVDITADAARQDIVREGFDAGVRFGRDVPQDMVAVRIGPPQRYAVVGAPGYFGRKPPPRSPRELPRHDCILRRFPGGATQQWEFRRRTAKVQLAAPRIVVNDALIAVTAAAAGGGLAYLHEKYVERELASGELVRTLEAWSPGIGPPYLYYPRQRYLPAALRAFVDFAREDGRAAESQR